MQLLCESMVRLHILSFYNFCESDTDLHLILILHIFMSMTSNIKIFIQYYWHNSKRLYVSTGNTLKGRGRLRQLCFQASLLEIFHARKVIIFAQ